jgi:hypothetical protein
MLAFLVHDCAVRLLLETSPNYRTSQRKPLNCRTLIDLLPSLKYDDCCRAWPPFRQLAAYRVASFPLSFRSLPYTPVGRCWLGTVFSCVIFAARAGLSAECPQYLYRFHSPRVGFRHCCPLWVASWPSAHVHYPDAYEFAWYKLIIMLLLSFITESSIYSLSCTATACYVLRSDKISCVWRVIW